LARHVSEGGVESSSYEDAASTKPDGHRIALQHQIFWHKLLTPIVLGEVILQNQLRVVGVTKKVALGDRFDFVVEELECVLVGELDNIVLQGANAFKQLARH
jgi:hypothetical protein